MLSAQLNADAENCYATGQAAARLKKEEAASSQPMYLACLVLSAITEAQAEKWSAASQNIIKYVAELSPKERSTLIDNPQAEHYLHRLVRHALKNPNPAHDEIIVKLGAFFPSKIKHFQENELLHSYCYSDVQSHSNVVSPQRRENTASHLFQYEPNKLAATFRAPQLQLEDIKRASFSVALEVKEQEKALYNSSLSPPKRSLSISTSRKPSRLVKMSPSKATIGKPALAPVLKSELRDPQFKTSKSGASLFPKKERNPHQPLQTAPVNVDGIPLKNAFDVIEAFASGALQSEAESVYLNYSHSDHCSPYNLSVTLRTKADPEHFVISNFGIIHVYPDGMSDFQTFADWLREASMFTLMRQIPFFREHKLCRFFRSWHKVVKSAQLHRLTLKINRISIRFFPIYADALLKLQHLNKELTTVPFHHLKSLGGYTVDAVEHSLQGSQTKAHQFLLKYFKYCRRIICSAIESSKKHATDLESEHHHQQFVPEVSLSIQKKRQEKLEQDLATATYQAERIADFVHLAEQLAYNCLLQIARQAVNSWKDVFLFPIPKQASKGFQIQFEDKGKKTPGKDADQKRGSYFLFSSLVIDESGKCYHWAFWH